MGNNGNNKLNNDIIKLGQWEFHTVSEGLDKEQVASLLDNLSRERDALIERTEHLTSLTKLAERTVSEADRLAEETLSDALNQAQQKAEKITEAAENDARQQREEIRKLQTDFSNSVRILLNQLLSGLDGFSQQMRDLATEIEQKLPEPVVEDTIAPEETAATPETSREAGVPEPEAALPEGSDEDDNKLLYELEILPPLDVMKIMEIVTYLDNMPEVTNTELIPSTERPLITVELNEPVQLVDILKSLPELAGVEDASGDEAAPGNPRKIRISLTESAVTQETK